MSNTSKIDKYWKRKYFFKYLFFLLYCVLKRKRTSGKKLKLRDGKEKMSSLAQLEGLETLRIVILIGNEIKYGEI